MQSYLQLLEKTFAPPLRGESKASYDFNAFNLTRPPPKDLLQLFDTYGPGKFECGKGDGIELLPTFPATVDMLKYVASNWLKVLKSGVCMDGENTIPEHYFDTSAGDPPRNLISWGLSDNGVELLSLWLSNELGWCVLVVPEAFNSAQCLFKSPAAVLWDALCGSGLRHIFPEAEPPYNFNRSRRIE